MTNTNEESTPEESKTNSMQCSVHPLGHVITYDASLSDATKNVYVCECTHQVTEYQASAP